MKEFPLFAEDCVILKDCLYCVCSDAAFFYSVDLKNKTIIQIDIVPEELFIIKQGFRRVLTWKDEIVFIPYNARCVHLYNPFSGEWRKSDYLSESYNNSLYLEAFINNNKLVIIGADEPNIIEMNLDDLSYKVVNTCLKRYKKSGEMICRGGYAIVDGYLYIAIATKNVVLKINLENWKDEECIVGNREDVFSGLLRDGDRFWLSPRRDGDVVIWDGKDFFETVKLPIIGKNNTFNFGGLCSNDKYIYIQGLDGEFTVKIDKNDRNMECYKKQYVFLKSINNKMIIGQLKQGELEIINNSVVSKIRCMIEKEQLIMLYKKCNSNLIFENNILNNEDVFFDLSEFLYCIKK